MRDVSLGLTDPAAPQPPPVRGRRTVNRGALLGVGILFALIGATLGAAYLMDRSKTAGPASADGLTIWSGGDSMSYYISAGLRRELEPDGAVFVQEAPEYVGGSGLLSTDFYDWEASIRDDVLPLDPDMIVFMIGANDANWLESDDYRARVAGLMDAMQRDGRYVVWIGQPNMEDAGFAANVQNVNDIIRDEASRRSWVRFVDTWGVSSDESGGYSRYITDENDGAVLARDDDGIHLTPEGGELLAKFVVRQIFEE